MRLQGGTRKTARTSAAGVTGCHSDEHLQTGALYRHIRQGRSSTLVLLATRSVLQSVTTLIPSAGAEHMEMGIYIALKITDIFCVFPRRSDRSPLDLRRLPGGASVGGLSSHIQAVKSF